MIEYNFKMAIRKNTQLKTAMENMKLTTAVTGILLTLILNNVQCKLITTPKDAAAKRGDFVIMRCSSSHVNDTCGGITWTHFKPNSTAYGDQINNAGDQLGPLFTPYISIIDSTAGNCDLKINATPSAAGRYECSDGNTDISAVMIVLENVPEVRVINQSSHGNVITTLECSVNYYGKLAPQVQWVKIVGNSWTNVTATENKIIKSPVLSLVQFSSIIQIPTDGATGHFMCDVTISTITLRSPIECPAGWNKPTKAKEPYNDGLGHGIGIGFAIGFFLCVIIFVLLWRFDIFPPKADNRKKDEENLQTNPPTSGGSQASGNHYEMVESPPSAPTQSET